MDRKVKEVMKKPVNLYIATWFGTGLLKDVLKIGGGTWGSIFAIPLCYLMIDSLAKLPLDIKIFWWLIALIVIFGAGIMSIPVAEKTLGKRQNWRGEMTRHDQSEICIDEVFGMMITCIPLLFLEFKSYIVVFIIALLFFRIFDMLKIPPARYFDEDPKWENEWGVMLDDGVAGAQAAICLGLTIWFFNL